MGRRTAAARRTSTAPRAARRRALSGNGSRVVRGGAVWQRERRFDSPRPLCYPRAAFGPDQRSIEEYDGPMRHCIWRGVRATIPVALSVVPFGVAFGTVAAGNMVPWQAQLMSLAVFAGTAQFIAASMLSEGAAYVPILLTGVLIKFVRDIQHAGA